MKKSHRLLRWAVLGIIVLAFTGAFAQKKDLKEADYKLWESLSSTMLSDNGEWLTYGISLSEGDGRLILKNLKSDREYTFPVASAPAFSKDMKWFAFNISYPQKKIEQMTKARQTIRNRMGLLNFTTSKIDTIEGINAFAFSKAGNFLIMRKYRPEGAKTQGSGLVYRNLDTGVDYYIGDVQTYILPEKHPNLIVITDTDDKFGNGIYLYNMTTNSSIVLDADRVSYLNLLWNEDKNIISFLKAKENKDYVGNYHTIVVITDLDKTSWGTIAFKKLEYNPEKDTTFPAGFRILEGLRWPRECDVISVSIKKWELTDEAKKRLEKQKPPEAKKDEEELPPPGVNVWHWKDVTIQPQQKLNATQDQNITYLAVWYINENKFVKLADDTVQNVSLSSDFHYALGYNPKPYQPSFKDSYNDVYLINTKTGDRVLFFQKTTGRTSFSPELKYLLYFKSNNWWAYDIANKTHTNITQNIKTRFENFLDDHPVAEKGAWGSGQWYKDDAAVLIYDQYDIWKVTPDGKTFQKLTDGAKDKIIYRFSRQFRTDTEALANTIDPTLPLYLSATGDFTKDTGFFRIDKEGIPPVKLIYESRSVSAPTKAKDADVFIFRRSKADESPNIFMTDVTFKTDRKLTNTNPQQKDYYWAGTELITYTNKNGVTLQGSLMYPANYEAGKKYPMIVWIYEKLSQGLHEYTLASNRSAYNKRVWSSMGFFYYEPDIVYRIGEPGISAVECVVPAVEAVIKKGVVDPQKIGLMGHSWGAYQTAFIITQTNLFSAAVAGAPLINMISMYSSVYWNTGSTNQVIFETSQGRLPNPYWEDWDTYVRNSPLFNAQNINTPFLVAFGDNDGAVDWNQGVEMYNAMRRRQKEFVMLVYDGENHSLSKREDQIDYAKRVQDWFKHYLLGEPAQDWIAKGVPYNQRPAALKATTQPPGTGGAPVIIR